MKLTPQEKNTTAHVLDMYVDTLIEMMEGQPHSPKIKLCVDELETIKSVLLKMLDKEPETVTGVLTIPTEPRTIDDIYSEMCSHPDFVAGYYFDKETIIEQIVESIEDEYPDDENEPGMYDMIYKDAEQIYKNNARQIFKNIDYWYMNAFEDADLLEDCDLTIENTLKEFTNIIEDDKNILNDPNFISLMKEYNFTKK
jgi:hypothetical protein